MIDVTLSAAGRVGNLGEWVTGSPAAVQNVTIYYYADSVRVAMRQGERVTYLLADHLGSTQVTADEQGSELGRYLYTAWGETRQVSGETATDRLYTGQRQEAEIGLYYYNARWYDPALGRFTQADTIVPEPGNVLAWDRYAYVNNNPMRYTDPSGHYLCGDHLSYCDPRRTTFDPNRAYQELKQNWEPLPDPALLETGANFPAKPNGYTQEEWELLKKEQTNKYYEEYRKALFITGYEFYIDAKGRIADEAMVSLVISGEFGLLKLTDPGSYNDHLSALSNQLHHNSYVTYGAAICPDGSCPSQKAQLVWLQAFQAWRATPSISFGFGPNSSSDPRPKWTLFIVDATKIIKAPFGSYNSFGIGKNGETILK